MSHVVAMTRCGIYLYAIRNSAKAAPRAIIKVRKINILAFAIAGEMSPTGGILSRLRILGVSVLSGVGGEVLLLECIATAVIVGVSLAGEQGIVVGTLFAVLIISTLSNGLNLMGVANQSQLIVTGLLIILAVSIGRVTDKLAGTC